MASSSSSSSSTTSSNKIWIGNLDSKVTEYQLMKILEPFGPIASFDFLYTVHPESGARTPKGYAFVTYTHASSAQKALQRLGAGSNGGKGTMLHGRTMLVRPATSNKAGSGSSAAFGRKRTLPTALAAGSSSSSSSASKEDKIRAMEAKLRAMQEDSSKEQFKLAVPGAKKTKK